MAISLESFLVLEKSLTKKILALVKKDIKEPIVEIFDLIASGDLSKAESKLLSLQYVLKDTAYLGRIGLAASLFGASQVSDKVGASTSFIGTEAFRADMSNSVKVSVTTLNNLLTTAITTPIANIIKDKRDNPNTDVFRRTTKQGIGDKIIQAVTISNSLHVSRMAAYGYLSEAAAKGVKVYRVTAQLDENTCPVCDTLDGKIFKVQDGLQKIRAIMSVTDPEVIKEMSPFPKQAKKDVVALQAYGIEDLVKLGFHTPPFHPMCRCTLVKV